MPSPSKKAPKSEQEKMAMRAKIDAALHAFLQAGRAIEQIPPRIAPEVPPVARHGTLVPEEPPL